MKIVSANQSHPPSCDLQHTHQSPQLWSTTHRPISPAVIYHTQTNLPCCDLPDRPTSQLSSTIHTDQPQSAIKKITRQDQESTAGKVGIPSNDNYPGRKGSDGQVRTWHTDIFKVSISSMLWFESGTCYYGSDAHVELCVLACQRGVGWTPTSMSGSLSEQYGRLASLVEWSELNIFSIIVLWFFFHHNVSQNTVLTFLA